MASGRASSISRESSRPTMATSCRPAGISVARSFSECTAKSTRPSSWASSSSLVKKPLPSSLEKGTLSMASPLVVMMVISVSTPRSFIMRAMVWACHRARSLPRVPMRHTPVPGPLLDAWAKSIPPR